MTLAARRLLAFAALFTWGALSSPRLCTAIGLDGAWNEIPPPMRAYHSAIYDPVRDRMIIYGGGEARMWQLGLVSQFWAPLDVSGSGPTLRSQHSAIYDPVRDRMIVFGGRPVSGVLLNDVWSLNLSGTPTWTRLFPSGTLPRARYGHSATYDPVRDRMVVFGGLTSSIPSSEVWELTLGPAPAWHKLTPIGDPGPRGGHSSVYDSARDRLLIYGGGGSTLSGYYDLWSLSFTDSVRWTRLSEFGPSWETRTGHTAYYDATTDRMILYGGHSDSYTDGGAELGDVSTFNFATASWDWNPTNADVPGFHAGILDPVRHRIVLHGGKGYDTFGHATVSIELTSPLCIVPLSGTLAPFGREGHAAAYDRNRDRLLVFGGRDFSYWGESVMSDLWAFSFATLQWTQLDNGNSGLPPGLHSHTAIFDPAADRLIAYGGLHAGSYLENRVLQYRFGAAQGWSDMTPAGSGPAPRYAHSAVLDPGGSQMLMFGGETASGTVGDLWSLSIGATPAWTQIVAGGTPPPVMSRHGAVYDPVARRMIIVSAAGVWGLSLTGPPVWTPIPTGAAPTPSYSSWPYWNTTGFDPVHNRVLVYSGSSMWSLDLAPSPAVWRVLAPDNPAPPSRVLGAVIWDDSRQRSMLFGGYSPGYIGSTYFFSDIWTLQFLDPATETTADLMESRFVDGVVHLAWRVSTPPVVAVVERLETGMAWTVLGSPTRDANSVLRCVDPGVSAGQMYRYRLRVESEGRTYFLGETSILIPIQSASYAIAPVATPMASLRIRLTLPRDYDRGAMIELLDIQGRRLDERRVGTDQAGSSILDLGRGVQWNPGVYLVRLRVPDGRSWTSRAVLFH